MLKIGETNNCEKCGASYSTYNVTTEGKDDWVEKWCQIPHIENGVIKEARGVCQFYNPKSVYYIKSGK